VKRGIYWISFSGGQDDISSGDYVFATNEAYLIEDGRLATPIRSTNSIGNAPDNHTRVTMVGSNLAVPKFGGTCRKGGPTGEQWMPASVGLPTVLDDGTTGGGTSQ
jgi:TldD protein